MNDWAAELRAGRPEAAWDLLLDRHRRLIFAAIRHYAQDYDDIMDVFARVCQALREDDLRRLRCYVDQPDHSATFSTWLVTVVRHITVDWFRNRDGRRRLSAVAEALPPLQRKIFEHVFLHKKSHIEAYELLKSADGLDIPFGRFLTEVSATYRAVAGGRRGSVFRELAAPPPTETSDNDDYAERREVAERALASLDAQDRVAIELYVLEELPAETVAKIIGLPNAKAVYNRVYRVLASLRAQFEHAGIRRGDL